MKLEFRLDGEAITLHSDPLTPAGELLARLQQPEQRPERQPDSTQAMDTIAIRNPCQRGLCGLCTIIFNGGPAFACLIPAYHLHKAEVLTAAAPAFVALGDSFRRAAELAGAHFCGYCNQARILAAWYALELPRPLDTTRLHEIAHSIRCPCVPAERFERALRYAIDIERNRMREHV